MDDTQKNRLSTTDLESTEPGSGLSTEATWDPKIFLERESNLPLRDIWRIILKRVWLILIGAFVLAGTVLGVSLIQTPMYSSSIQILIGEAPRAPEQGFNNLPVPDLQQLTQTMNNVVQSKTVANEVIQQQGLQVTSDEFLENMNAEQVGATQVIRVEYIDPNPEIAQRVANSIGDVFSEQVSQVSANANAVTATVWERAEVSDKPVSPKLLRNTAIALIVGLMLGVALALLQEYLNEAGDYRKK